MDVSYLAQVVSLVLPATCKVSYSPNVAETRGSGDVLTFLAERIWIWLSRERGGVGTVDQFPLGTRGAREVSSHWAALKSSLFKKDSAHPV